MPYIKTRAASVSPTDDSLLLSIEPGQDGYEQAV